MALDNDPNSKERLPGTPALHGKDRREEKKALSALPRCILCGEKESLSLRNLGPRNILICGNCRSEFNFLASLSTDDLKYVQVRTTGNLKGIESFIGRKYVPPIPYDRISEDLKLKLPGEPPRNAKEYEYESELEKKVDQCPVCGSESSLRSRNFKLLRRIVCIQCRSIFAPIHTFLSGRLKHLRVVSIGNMTVHSYLVGKRFLVDEGRWDGVKKSEVSPPIQKVEGSAHGNHWITVLGDREIEDVFSRLSGKKVPILAHVAWKGHNIEHGKVMENRMLAMTTEDDDVRTIAVNMNKTLWTAYPATYHQMEVKPKIVLSSIWKAGIEGWITFSMKVGDAETELTGFDPLFFIHRGAVEKDLPLGLAGFCYSAQKGKDKEFDAPDMPEGKARLTKEGGWLIPLRLLESGADRDPDEYHLRMLVTDRKDIRIFSDPGYLYRGNPFGSANKEFELPVIVRKDRIKGKHPEIGDSFSGEIWLQSYTVGCQINGRDLTSN